MVYDWPRLAVPGSLAAFEQKWGRRNDPYCFSGVWRFHELLPFAPLDQCVTVGEGQTLLRASAGVARYAGLAPGRLALQYEGMNPSGSFKDNGMAAAFSHARLVGASRAACASTGNTSASLALYCSATGLMRPVIFIGSGKISYGKLSQALDYGALTLQIAGDFDDAMARVQEVCQRLGHLPGQQRQPVPAGRPEDDHVPRAGGPAAGSRPIGSPCPAETWATAALSARRFTNCTSWG